MAKIKPKLSKVPETLLLPLRGRYNETKRKNGIINDPKSVEILEQIDYDFTNDREFSIQSQIGVANRTQIMDELTVAFLTEHPEGQVINFGCGLDTRFYRLDNSKCHWFDLDLPESIDLRKHFFQDTDRYHLIAKSIFDYSWIQDVDTKKTTLFIAEGLFMYFEEAQLKELFTQIRDHFQQAEIIFEGMSPIVARNTQKHPDMKHVTAKFRWGIKNGKEIEKWGCGMKFIKQYKYCRNLSKMPFWLMLFYSTIARNIMKIIHLKWEK